MSINDYKLGEMVQHASRLLRGFEALQEVQRAVKNFFDEWSGYSVSFSFVTNNDTNSECVKSLRLSMWNRGERIVNVPLDSDEEEEVLELLKRLTEVVMRREFADIIEKYELEE